jgi:hypothetical protein
VWALSIVKGPFSCSLVPCADCPIRNVHVACVWCTRATDDTRALSASADGELRLWDLVDGEGEFRAKGKCSWRHSLVEPVPLTSPTIHAAEDFASAGCVPSPATRATGASACGSCER